MVHAAYISDDLDYLDLERLIDAALRGEPTEIPEPMLSRFWPPTWTDAMKEMWTSPRVLIPPTDAPDGVLLYRPTVAERLANISAQSAAFDARMADLKARLDRI